MGIAIAIAVLLCMLNLSGAEPGADIFVGAVKIDVTPDYPIRMGGYAVRKVPSEGIEQRIWTKAIAVRVGTSEPVVLVTVDNNGIAEQTYRAVVKRLGKSARLSPQQIVICSSHTHTGPLTSGKSPNLFSEDIPAEDQAVIDRYTGELISKIERAALDALKTSKRAELYWAQGTVEFARNRRTTSLRPVDHSLPVLLAKDEKNQPIAIVATYACHCTTLGAGFRRICGDWAGYAQEDIERMNPGAVSLISIGCGADANPYPREGEDAGLALAKQHGRSIASEVHRLVSGGMKPLTPNRISTRIRELDLPFSPHFSKEQWEERAQKPGVVGYHARKNLARLQRGEELAKTLYYPMVTWSFDDQLLMSFLPGEVVVDYATRLRNEHPKEPLWITAYANYVPCYIPSKRILAEGGYEAEDSLWYYDRPSRLSPTIEDMIVNTLGEMLGER